MNRDDGLLEAQQVKRELGEIDEHFAWSIDELIRYGKQAEQRLGWWRETKDEIKKLQTENTRLTELVQVQREYRWELTDLIISSSDERIKDALLTLASHRKKIKELEGV